MLNPRLVDLADLDPVLDASSGEQAGARRTGRCEHERPARARFLVECHAGTLRMLFQPRQGTLKLERFLEALQGKQLISPDRFVASVEFGNELMSGSGTTWINDFDVLVTPR